MAPVIINDLVSFERTQRLRQRPRAKFLESFDYASQSLSFPLVREEVSVQENSYNTIHESRWATEAIKTNTAQF